MKRFNKPLPKLADANAFRLAHGLEPFKHLPTVMRPGKTESESKAEQRNNRAAHAARCQALKTTRQQKGR